MFRFADRWSARTTWGGGDPPVSGDSVVIPENETVLLDVSPPRLELLVVMGELVFLDQQDLELIARHIMVRGGAIRIGAPGVPHRHRAVITLYGDRRDYAIPLYGAKVLAVREGLLDLHGLAPRMPWTRLSATASAGETSIEVRGDASDWPVGGEIMIAATDHWHDEAETRLITGVQRLPADPASASCAPRTRLQLDRPLRSVHLSARYSYQGRLYDPQPTSRQLRDAQNTIEAARMGSGSQPVDAGSVWKPRPVADTERHIDVAAEVALLTRNVVVRGDMPTSFDVQYGAQIHVLSPERIYGPRSVLVRMDGVEMRQVGQAFWARRHPLLLSEAGDMQGSYVRRCSVHRSYNGAIVLDRVQGVVLDDNVAYDIRGHAIRVGSTGAETGNVIRRNLVAVVRPVWSLLLTEQTPAAFYLRNPSNYIQDNAVAGASHHGFWFHVPRTPDEQAVGAIGGPSGNGVEQCPRRAALGSFEGNVVHSVGGAGVWFSQPWMPSAPHKPWETAFDGEAQAGPPAQFGVATNGQSAALMGATRGDGPEGTCSSDARPAPALLHDTLVYKASGPAMRAVALGAVSLDGFRVGDTLGSGLEVQFWGGDRMPFSPFLRRALLVDRTPNAYTAARGWAALHLPGLSSGLVVEDAILGGYNRTLRACYGCPKAHTGGYDTSFANLTFYPAPVAGDAGLDEEDAQNVTQLVVRDEEVDGISAKREGYMGWSQTHVLGGRRRDAWDGARVHFDWASQAILTDLDGSLTTAVSLVEISGGLAGSGNETVAFPSVDDARATMTPGVLLPTTAHTRGLAGPMAPPLPGAPDLDRLTAEGVVRVPPICRNSDDRLLGPTASACRHLRAIRMAADQIDYRFRGVGLRVKLMVPGRRGQCEDWSTWWGALAGTSAAPLQPNASTCAALPGSSLEPVPFVSFDPIDATNQPAYSQAAGESYSANLGTSLGTVRARYVQDSHPTYGWQFTAFEGFEHDLWFESPSPALFPLTYRVSANRLGRIRQLWRRRYEDNDWFWGQANPAVLDAVPREYIL